jgi:hypothetical protein
VTARTIRSTRTGTSPGQEVPADSRACCTPTDARASIDTRTPRSSTR